MKNSQVGPLIIVVGLLVFVYGAGPALGLATVDSVGITNASSVCSPAVQMCSVGATFTNNNYTLGGSVFVQLNVANQNGQQVSSQFAPLTATAGTSIFVGFNIQPIVDGAYVATFYAITGSGVPISKQLAYDFTTGAVQIPVYVDATNGISVTSSSPTPVSTSPGNNPSITLYSYPENTPVTITYHNSGSTLVFQCGASSYPGEICTSSGTTQTIKFTASSTNAQNSIGIAPETVPAGSTLFIPIFPMSSNTAIGNISPAVIQDIYPSGSGASSLTYTTNAPTSAVKEWDIVNVQNVSTRIAGSISTATITYAQVAAQQATGNPYVQATIEVVMSPNVLQILPVVGPSGTSVTATLSPTIGQYAETAGASVTVTISNIQTGYCLSFWQVDQVDGTTTNPTISVTVNGLTTVQPFVGKCAAIAGIYLSASTGITTSPTSPGTYTPVKGSQFSVTETTQPGYCFVGWQEDGALVQGSRGTASTFTLTADGNTHLLGAVGLVANAIDGPSGGICTNETTATFTIGTDSLYPGSVSTNPVAGTYSEAFGSQVSVTASVNSGYCWAGWYLKGAYYSGSLTTTVTMPTTASAAQPVLTATTTPINPSVPCSTLTAGPPGNANLGIAAIGAAIAGAGAFITKKKGAV